MFLFLSKLIPLFIYPLGLTCILLGVAIATFWKQPRTSAIALALALTILLIGANPLVANGLIRSLEGQYPSLTQIPQAEAIVILGGSTLPTHPPRPWVEISEAGDRILYGAKLYREGQIPWVILSGGRIPWQGGTTTESADMAELLQSMGVPKTALLQDQTSLNTYENAVNVKRLMQANQLQGPILLVTSATHMPRSMAIFEKQGIQAIAAPTDFQVTTVDPYAGTLGFAFKFLPDANPLKLTTKVFKEYLGWLTYRLRGWL